MSSISAKAFNTSFGNIDSAPFSLANSRTFFDNLSLREMSRVRTLESV